VLRQFVAVVDGPQNESYAVRCAVMWHAVRDIASQPPQAASDATSGVPRHSEVSEAPQAPQKPVCRRCHGYGIVTEYGMSTSCPDCAKGDG
jgi:hypothetical protein